MQLFQTEGPTHGRPLLLKKDKVMYCLLKHGEKSFPAPPVPFECHVIPTGAVSRVQWYLPGMAPDL